MEKNRKQRPILPDDLVKGDLTEEELLQNEVIRPIIKLQSDLIKAIVLNQLKGMNVDLNSMDQFKRKKQINSLFQKNQQFKREIIGMVIGQFDLNELDTYFKFQKEINRRIVQIAGNRMVDQLA
tara:strand:- start:37572 stop:37943 length:372 start_codon:yes stop_codon:yes gene_type:complete